MEDGARGGGRRDGIADHTDARDCPAAPCGHKYRNHFASIEYAILASCRVAIGSLFFPH